MSDSAVAIEAMEEEFETGKAWGEVPDQDTIKDESPEAVKELARELGWNDKFDGDPSEYVDAATYIRRSKDINEAKRSQISGLKKQLKEINNVVSELKTHNERVYKAEVKRLTQELDELKAQRRSAIEDGDVDRVEKIEKQMAETHDLVTEAKPTADKVSDSSWNDWVDANPWYKEDDEMRVFADKAGLEYEGLPFDKILKLVLKDTKAEFPERFGAKAKTTEKKTAISPVESGSRRVSSGKSKTESDLSPAQRSVMNQFVRQGVMTKAEYIADLVKVGEL